MKFQQLFRILTEADVLNVGTRRDPKWPDTQKPLMDTQVIRVYHGFRDLIDCVEMCQYGLDGSENIHRTYSYENNNNPKGLFVTANPQIAKEFGQWIVEFHAKVSDLEAPVWPGGTYTVQGGMEQFFDHGTDQREQARLKAREKSLKSEYESIRNSDRPELAESLYWSHEHQALFKGTLNANSIRAIWVNKTPERDGKYSEYERMSRREFLKRFGKTKRTRYGHDWRTGKYETTEEPAKHAHKLFKPREPFNFQTLIDRLVDEHGKGDRQFIEDAVRHAGLESLRMYVWPNQYPELEKAYNEYIAQP